MHRDKTDEEIVALFKDGDSQAFKELLSRYTSPLYNYSARFVGPSNAPDIVQIISVKIWKNLSHFNQDKASFKTWAFTIARNTITDFLRKKKSVVFSDLDGSTKEDEGSFVDNIPDENLLPDESMQKLQDVATLNQALEKLSPLSREVLVLYYQEDLTFAEIGKILDKPLNTVKSQHRRALLSLRKILK